MITFDNVSKIYQTNGRTMAAVENVALKIEPKEFVSIVGRSGAGKTTLFKLLIAEEEPTKGKVYFADVDVHTLPKKTLPTLRRRIGMIFQDFKLLAQKTVFENVAFAMEVAGMGEEEIQEDVPQALELVGLSDKSENFPHELSGGEKQRVAIARALIQRPEVILADEPTGNLDPLTGWDIVQLLVKINQLGTTVVLASHDKDVVNKVGKRVVTLDQGRIVRDEEEGKYVL